MSVLYLNSVFLCIVPMMICSPTPQQQNSNGNQDRNDEQNQAIDSFTSGLVDNPGVRKNYLNCFLENGPCSPEVNSVRRKC